MGSLRQTYDRIAEDWHRDHANDAGWMEATDLFVRQLPIGGRVLDVGCSTGIKTRYLSARGQYPVGIDNSPVMLGIARRESPPGIEYQLMDMAGVTVFGRTFVGVYLHAVLLHVRKASVPQTLRDMTSLLVSGGCLYVAVKERRAGQVEEEVRKERDYGFPYERFFSYFTHDEVLAFMAEAGATPIHSRTEADGGTRWIQAIGKMAP